MSDLVKRHREEAANLRQQTKWPARTEINFHEETADEIERLTAENERLKIELRSLALDALATLEPIK